MHKLHFFLPNHTWLQRSLQGCIYTPTCSVCPLCVCNCKCLRRQSNTSISFNFLHPSAHSLCFISHGARMVVEVVGVVVGGTAAVQVFEGTPLQFNVRSWTSCFSEWHLQQCVYPFCVNVRWLCVCVCARVHPSEVAATESLSPPHTPASLQDWAPPHSPPPQPTHRTSHVSCLPIKGRSSPSWRFPLPCVGPRASVELVWLRFNSQSLSPCISFLAKDPSDS